MAEMGKYCKAYMLGALRKFDGWREDKQTGEPLTDESIVYVQENYVVTGGIFKDEDIIFDAVTPEWEAYCRQELAFEMPDFDVTEVS